VRRDRSAPAFRQIGDGARRTAVPKLPMQDRQPSGPRGPTDSWFARDASVSPLRAGLPLSRSRERFDGVGSGDLSFRFDPCAGRSGSARRGGCVGDDAAVKPSEHGVGLARRARRAGGDASCGFRAKGVPPARVRAGVSERQSRFRRACSWPFANRTAGTRRVLRATATLLIVVGRVPLTPRWSCRCGYRSAEERSGLSATALSTTPEQQAHRASSAG
jgi:hypothetical protein